MIRSFVYRALVLCILRTYRVFVSFIVHFSYRSCEAFVRFSFVLFAFSVRLHFVRIVNLYDPGSVYDISWILRLLNGMINKRYGLFRAIRLLSYQAKQLSIKM